MSDENALPLGYESNQAQVAPRTVCANCGVRMIRGVIVSRGDAAAAGPPSGFWVEGEPTKGWLGMWRVPKGRRYEIATYRCPSCGRLENYSPVG